MRRIVSLGLATILALAGGAAPAPGQDKPEPPVSNSASVDLKQLRAVEATLGKQFDEIRRREGLKPLHRINSDQKSRQLLCSNAVILERSTNSSSSLAIKIANINKPPPEFQNMAELGKPRAGSIYILPQSTIDSTTRYAITAWPASTAGAYWVNVDLHGDAFEEWWYNHFDEGTFDKNRWTEKVQSECKNVK